MAMPDANIHPKATGLVVNLVAAHQNPAPLTLYSAGSAPSYNASGPCSRRSRRPYQYVEMNPYHKPDSLLSLNPRGLVPTLEYEGKVLDESSVVLEFVEDVWSEGGLV